MWITQDEAVVMFARYCRARFGKSAIQQVKSKAAALEKRGDTKGHHVWNKVADEIEKKSKLRSERFRSAWPPSSRACRAA